MDFWDEQLKIRNAILKGEQEAAASRPPAAPVNVVRDWQLAAEQRARQAETDRTRARTQGKRR